MNFVLLYSFISVAILQVKPQEVDYYWRDYNGVIPEDALRGGKDINGNDTYIGQVYVQGHGLFVGQLVPGRTEIEVACYGVKRRNYLLKILCSKHKANFSWLPTSWTSFHMDTINKHAVVGGYDHVGNKGIINIGRVMHQGILKIGHVASYKVEQAFFYFEHKNRQEKVKSYEVLIYNKAPDFSIDERLKVYK